MSRSARRRPLSTAAAAAAAAAALLACGGGGGGGGGGGPSRLSAAGAFSPPQHAPPTAPSSPPPPPRFAPSAAASAAARGCAAPPLRASSIGEVTSEGGETAAKAGKGGADPIREEVENNVAQVKATSKDAKSSLKAAVMDKIGTVDEGRLAFPDYVSGDVPRLFSNLEYGKSDDGRVTSSYRTAGSTMGAAALIAGTTVGGGMLALPAASDPAGFLPSSAALVLTWGYMVASGLLISELSLNRIGGTGRPGAGLLDVYRSSLGPALGSVASAAYFFLHYAAMTAFVAQGGAGLESLIAGAGVSVPPGVGLGPEALGPIAFAAAMGIALSTAGGRTVERANDVMALGVMAAFLGVVGVGAGSSDFAAVFAMDNQHPERVVDAFPILFLCLVYHNVVPTVVNKLEGDRTKITKAIVGGTALPLLMYLAWNAVVLGNVAGVSDGMAGNVDPIALLENAGRGFPMLGFLLAGFSELAIVTTTVGLVYGVVDALTDAAGLPKSGPTFDGWKPALFAGALAPPLAMALAYPDVFYSALDLGGAFGVSALFLVLPPVMVWRQRYGEEHTPLTVKPMVPGGKLSLGSLWKAAGTLIVEQGAEKLGIIDFIEKNLFHW